jgi:hypothetical protein
MVLLQISPPALLFYHTSHLLSTLLSYRWLLPYRGLSLSYIPHYRSRSSITLLLLTHRTSQIPSLKQVFYLREFTSKDGRNPAMK